MVKPVVLLALFVAGAFAGFSEEHNIPQLIPNQDELFEQFLPHADSIRKWMSTLYSSYELPRADYLDCEVCSLAVPAVRILLNLNVPVPLIVQVVIIACEIADLAPEDSICDPTIRSYAEPLLYIVQNRPNYTMQDICGIMNPGCHPVNPELSNSSLWNIQIDPVKPAVLNPPPLGNVQPAKVLQFTDIHLDLDYKEGTKTECPHPICCREDIGVPDDPKDGAGPYGHFSCALPQKALEAMFAHAKTQVPNPKFVYLTGDYIHSGIWLYTKEENARHLRAVAEMTKAYFPGVPIFAVFGNHEPAPVNMYPPPEVWEEEGGKFDLRWMYDAIGEPLEIPEDQLETFRLGGYYTVVPEPGFRIVTVNTNICYINNFWLVYNTKDPFGQLQWLANTLLAAERANEMVHILGHIQPGSGSCWPPWAQKYNDILYRFENIIKAQFYGHSHNDYFTLTFEPGVMRPTGTLFIGPSGLTDGMDPGYKIYETDGARGQESTWEMMDYQTWILNLTQSNDPSASDPVWIQLYEAKRDYGLDSLRPKDMYDFTLRMINDEELFQKYHGNVYKQTTGNRRRPCHNDNCKIGYLCDNVQANSNDNFQCDHVKDLVSRRNATTPAPTTPSSGNSLRENSVIVSIMLSVSASIALAIQTSF